MARNKNYIKMINTARWRHLRNRVILEQPLCQRCKDKGLYRSASEVHHIVPVESTRDALQQERLMFDRDNLMALCRDCHHEIHRAMLSRKKEKVIANTREMTRDTIRRFFGEE